MMKYRDVIEIREGFQASVNLEYDLNRIEKVQNYIPTEQSVGVLSAFLRSYYYQSEAAGRATVLVGPYGRGKSHLLLVLSALTSLDVRARTPKERKQAEKIVNELCGRIQRVDEAAGALARAIVDSGIRTLPVIINSNSTDMNQAFLAAIHDALEQAELQTLLPSTYFDSATAMIDKWEMEFPKAYEALARELKKHKTTIENLRIGLGQFQQQAYDLFCQCYPLIAAGAQFNPLSNMDVVKLYMSVAASLREQTAYCGMTVIFDEFSKFLEANLEKSKMRNFKLIQDLAEAAVRSREAQLHFTCITHKDILDYSSSDSFKTVEGRFRNLHFVDSSEQSYGLIANAIVKKPSFRKFRSEQAAAFQSVAEAGTMMALFSDLTPESYEELIVSGCFPLAPLSVFSLLRVSELVGQNERTLFTFLSQKDTGSFGAFIEQETESPAWITVDHIYDYFEVLLKKEVFNQAVHSVWAKTNSALHHADTPAQTRVLKAIAVINLIADERLRPVSSHIKAALLMDDADFQRAAGALLKRHILSQRNSSEYVLLTADGVDAQRSIDNYVKTSLAKLNFCETLARACDLGFVLPRAYNDRYSMFRCFKNIYMDAGAFMQSMDPRQLLGEYPYDGLIVHLVSTDGDALPHILERLRTYAGFPQIVVCATKLPFDLEGLLKQYEAAEALLAKNEDPHFAGELEILREDLEKRIREIVYSMYAPSSEYSVFANCEGTLDVSRRTDLNHAVSEICGRTYGRTPVVNNEMVNKRVLSGQIIKARNIVLDWILQHAEDSTLPCMEGYGPEVSIFKSAYRQAGLDISSTAADPGMNEVLELIGRFMRDSEGRRQNFQPIYQALTAAPYGMRKGIIPLYIAYTMRQYQDSIVLYFKGKEIELSASTLSSLNDSPESYELLIERGTADKDRYLERLQALFSKYVDLRSPSSNRVYSVVKSMQNWIRSLPEYTKKFKRYFENGEIREIDSAARAIRSELIKFEINSRELLFDTWRGKLSANGDLEECYEAVRRTKELLDAHLRTCRKELVKKLTGLFAPGYQGSLTRSLKDWYHNLPDSAKTHLFDASANALLATAAAIDSYDDDSLLDQLVAIFASIAVEDWNDAMADTFLRNAAGAVQRIGECTEPRQAAGQEGRLLISTGEAPIEKTFAAGAITPLGKTALNNLRSVFEDYSDTLSPDEQLAIIAQLISEILR